MFSSDFLARGSASESFFPYDGKRIEKRQISGSIITGFKILFCTGIDGSWQHSIATKSLLPKTLNQEGDDSRKREPKRVTINDTVQTALIIAVRKPFLSERCSPAPMA